MPPQSNSCAIAVMAKAPIPGKTKTRLVPPLSYAEAAELNAAFLADIAENLAEAAAQVAIAPFMAFGPPGTAPYFESNLPRDVGLFEIWLPNFGDCLHATIAALLDMGYGAACVLNSDSPTLPTDYLVTMAQMLAEPGDRAVLGPSTDGGYYLLALKRPHRRLFDDIAWSTEQVAAQTRARATELGLELVELPPWYDVDDAQSLHRLVGDIAGTGASAGSPPHRARHTATAVTRIFAASDIAREPALPVLTAADLARA